jgi:hypothetical protein
MVAIWSACPTPCKYPFPLKSVHFEFLTIFLIFILVAILKILKTKSTTLSDDLFVCQVSKGSAVWFEFNIFLHLGYHGNGRHFEFVQPQKLSHTTVDIPAKFYKV